MYIRDLVVLRRRVHVKLESLQQWLTVINKTILRNIYKATHYSSVFIERIMCLLVSTYSPFLSPSQTLQYEEH